MEEGAKKFGGIDILINNASAIRLDKSHWLNANYFLIWIFVVGAIQSLKKTEKKSSFDVHID